jgi:hypothetical protein
MAGVDIGFLGIHGNGKHSRAFEGTLYHGAVAGFKNVKGQQVVGKKDSFG